MFDKILQKITTNPNTRLVFIDLPYSPENILKAKPGERLIDYNTGHIYIKHKTNNSVLCKTEEIMKTINDKIGLVNTDANGNLVFNNHIVWHEGNLTPSNYLLRSGGIMSNTLSFEPVNSDFTFIKLNIAGGKEWKLNYLNNANNNSIKFVSTATNKSLELTHTGLLSVDELKTNLSKVHFGANRLEYNSTDNLMELYIGANNTGRIRYSKNSDNLLFNNVILSPSGDNKLNVGIKNTTTKLFIGHTAISGYGNPLAYVFGDGTIFKDIEVGNTKINGNMYIVGTDKHAYLPNESYIKASLADGSASIPLIGLTSLNKISIGDNSKEILLNTNTLTLPTTGVTSLSKNTTKVEMSDSAVLMDVKTSNTSVMKINKTGILDILSGINLGGITIKKNTTENTLDILFA